MPGRKYSGTSNYRYGFNWKENDNEVKGTGNQQDYGMRVYDPRLGKFLSVDPLSRNYPWYSPYHFAGNTPIQAIDLDGGEPQGTHPNSSYGKLHGTNVKEVPSQYDGTPYEGSIGSYTGIITAFAVQDVASNNHRTFVIFEDVHKTRQWYWEYDKDGWKGNLASFDWYTPPNSANALTAITVAPLVALPGLLVYGSAAAGYVGNQGYNLLARVYPYLPWIGEAGRKAAEFLDETGTIGGANASRTLIDEKRLGHIFRKEVGHFFEDTPDARKVLEDVANDAENLLGGDSFGNGWYAKLNEKGQQVWVQVREGKIINGGLNETPREFNVKTGLSAPEPPNKINSNE